MNPLNKNSHGHQESSSAILYKVNNVAKIPNISTNSDTTNNFGMWTGTLPIVSFVLAFTAT